MESVRNQAAQAKLTRRVLMGIAIGFALLFAVIYAGEQQLEVQRQQAAALEAEAAAAGAAQLQAQRDATVPAFAQAASARVDAIERHAKGVTKLLAEGLNRRDAFMLFDESVRLMEAMRMGELPGDAQLGDDARAKQVRLALESLTAQAQIAFDSGRKWADTGSLQQEADTRRRVKGIWREVEAARQVINPLLPIGKQDKEGIAPAG